MIRTTTIGAAACVAIAGSAGPLFANGHANGQQTAAADEHRAVLVGQAGALPGSPHTHDHKTTSETRSVSMITMEDDGGSYEIKIDGDKTTAKINGKQISADRIKRDADVLMILDDAGEVLHEFPVGEYLAVQPSGRLVNNFPMAYRAAGESFFDVDVDVQHPPVMVGINQSDVPAALRYHLRLPSDKGAILLDNVIEGLPAWEAGLRRHDVVVAIDGEKDVTPRVLRRVLSDKSPGEHVAFTVISAGEMKNLTVELEAYEVGRLTPGRDFVGIVNVPGVAEAPSVPGLLRWQDAQKDIGEYGRALRGETERAILEELRLRGVQDDEIRERVDIHLKGLEESLRDRLSGAEHIERSKLAMAEAREAIAAANNRFAELRENQLVLPGRNAWAENMSDQIDDRIAALEDRFDRLEDRIEDRLDRHLERLERYLDRLEED